MFAGLLASARELRFPLTVGYAALFATWVLFGEPIEAAARNDPLGLRLLSALESLGSPAEIGIITFAAAMLGSVLWNGAVRRLVSLIARKSGHPNWQELIDEARKAARSYEEYTVVSTRGQTGGRLSPSVDRHTVPSTAWATHLVERAHERERKQAEMAFRVTLAISLLPVALALGVAGGGWWWLSLVLIPIVWLDLALMKHTTLRVVNRYKLEDLQERQRALRELIISLNAVALDSSADPVGVVRVQEEIEEAQKESDAVLAAIDRITKHSSRRMTKFFDFVQGKDDD